MMRVYPLKDEKSKCFEEKIDLPNKPRQSGTGRQAFGFYGLPFPRE